MYSIEACTSLDGIGRPRESGWGALLYVQKTSPVIFTGLAPQSDREDPPRFFARKSGGTLMVFGGFDSHHVSFIEVIFNASMPKMPQTLSSREERLLQTSVSF